ncbi:dnaJ subfamily C member 7-like protein, partial [Leptotrombidium deliense]
IKVDLLRMKYNKPVKSTIEKLAKIMESINPDELCFRGFCFYYFGEPELAVIYLRYASLITPNSQEFDEIYKRVVKLCEIKHEAKISIEKSQFCVAYRHYTNALTIDETNDWQNAKLYFNRSIVAVKMNNIRQAIDDCSRAIELKQNYLKAYLKRGTIYFENSMFMEAAWDFQIVCDIDNCSDYIELLREARSKMSSISECDRLNIIANHGSL